MQYSADGQMMRYVRRIAADAIEGDGFTGQK